MFAEGGERGVTGGRPLDLSAVSRIWPNYFPQVEFSLEDRKLKLVALLADFFCTPQAEPFLSQVQDDCGTFFLPINMQHFQKACGIDEFYAVLEEAPKEALSCMGAAVHMLVSVRGSVVKVSTTRPLVLQMEFACGKCGTVIARAFPDGKFSPPVACSIHGCRSRTFIPNRSTAKLMDFQKIRVQELLKSENHEEGRVPRTVECELAEDLVDSCIPGDVITVTGIIKVINNYMDIGGGRSKNKNQGLYYLYLEAVSVRNSKSQSTEDVHVTNSESGAYMLFDFFSFSPRDLEFIVKFSEEHGSDIFRQIVHSFCPSIYGHELVKAGIVLALFGGVQKHSVDQNKVPVRGDIHVIIVGDPGLGKSQLLQAAAAVSPRGIYVCGNATTNAGLTVAVVKDPMTSDYAFEAAGQKLSMKI
ncbi:ATPase family associated with various cellular activities (AAA) [Musa troglodytarum]|uniref:Probable DNA helicase MCM8 n=1 Tax=Musa troglodytarum TaxID=320322 RepID=A0A9E7ELF2_9LILI|nr:ATPase family associated with various cellular activities (AAA) [Musa troglodytarum]